MRRLGATAPGRPAALGNGRCPAARRLLEAGQHAQRIVDCRGVWENFRHVRLDDHEVATGDKPRGVRVRP
jgi:hypothetical protein